MLCLGGGWLDEPCFLCQAQAFNNGRNLLEVKKIKFGQMIKLNCGWKIWNWWFGY